MQIIQSTNDYEIQVSDEDYYDLLQYNWYVLDNIGKTKQVHRHEGAGLVSMGDEILKRRSIPLKHLVDHKDRNPLNYQFENLRPATHSQNAANRSVATNSTSGYKGVHYCQQKKSYLARIAFRSMRTFLGKFTNPIDAAKAYDLAAKQLFGAFAVLNFPEEA